jgi:glucose-1-phosphate adenylyltransferase
LIHFFEANIGLTEDLPKFNLFDNDNKILPDLDYFRHQNFKKTIVERSLISEGCILNAKEISNSVMIRARIGEGTVIQIAMLWVMISIKIWMT